MESVFKFKGEKFERNLSFHEAAKILGTSNVKILELLRQKEVLFKQNNRNLPYEKYLSKKWFEVSYSDVENSGFKGMVPIVRITKIGFEEIEKLIVSEPDFIKNHNQRTFWSSIRLMIIKKLIDLKVGFNNVDDWLKKNSITHVNNSDEIVTIFTFIDNNRFDLISYDIKNKKILNNE